MTLHALSELAVNPMNPQSLMKWAGVWAVWLVIFAETGLLVGFFLPGDTLLFLAGVASSSIANQLVGTHLPFISLLIFTPLVAFAGAQCGYLIGQRYGIRLFDKPDSRIFKREYVAKTEVVFERFGGMKAVVLARFIPVVRTFLNPAAAILEMPVRRFVIANIIGAVIWTDSILLIGHFLANEINKTIGANNIDKLILSVVALVIVVAALPLAVDLIRRTRARHRGEAARGANRAGESGTGETGAEGAESAESADRAVLARRDDQDMTVELREYVAEPTVRLATVPDRFGGVPPPEERSPSPQTAPPPAGWPRDAPPRGRHGRHEGQRGA